MNTRCGGLHQNMLGGAFAQVAGSVAQIAGSVAQVAGSVAQVAGSVAQVYIESFPEGQPAQWCVACRMCMLT